MKAAGASIIFAVDVGAQDDRNYTNYGDHLSGFWLLWKKWNPWAEPVSHLTVCVKTLAYYNYNCKKQLLFLQTTIFFHNCDSFCYSLKGPRALHTKLQKVQLYSIHTTTFFKTATIWSTVLYMGNNFHNNLFRKIFLSTDAECVRAFKVVKWLTLVKCLCKYFFIHRNLWVHKVEPPSSLYHLSIIYHIHLP